jgi:2-polyprenyl-6-methoxyphenol hydroxylase-like FAD-dependent oxidoreductase
MNYEVVIAGAGPVGLFLACELRLAGVSVLLLEKLEETRTPLKTNFMGARGMNLPSVEAFYRRGMLEAVKEVALGWMDPKLENGVAMRLRDGATSPMPPRFAGHFAGILLDGNKIEFGNDHYRLPGPSAGGGMVSLAGVEGVLTERAEKLGVVLRLGAEVTDFTQGEEGVEVRLGDETIRTQWLVGCDGGRSTVRKRAGFEFVGTDPELMGYLAMVDLADPEKLKPGFNLTDRGMYVNGPAPGRIGVTEFDSGVDRDAPITLEAMQERLRRVSGTDVTLTALHLATRYTDNARQATTYRSGRVLLAGDAAHVHSPLGGQGMNLGIGDAMNLGWKLAATIQGWAPDDLLDSYTTERHPIGAWVLDWTRAQVAIMRPGPHGHAIRKVVRDLIDTRDGATYFGLKVAGVWQKYDLPGDHALIGRSAPDLELEDGTRMGELLHDGKAVLLDLGESEDLARSVETWKGRVRYVRARAKNDLGLRAFVVRPDGYVVWATEGQPDAGEARKVMARWFGRG